MFGVLGSAAVASCKSSFSSPRNAPFERQSKTFVKPELYELDYDRFGLSEKDKKRFKAINEHIRIKLGSPEGGDFTGPYRQDFVQDAADYFSNVSRLEHAIASGVIDLFADGFTPGLVTPVFSASEIISVANMHIPSPLTHKDVGVLLSCGFPCSLLYSNIEPGSDLVTQDLGDSEKQFDPHFFAALLKVIPALKLGASLGADIYYINHIIRNNCFTVQEARESFEDYNDSDKLDLSRLFERYEQVFSLLTNLDREFVARTIGGKPWNWSDVVAPDRTTKQAREHIADFSIRVLKNPSSICIIYPAAGHDLLGLNLSFEILSKSKANSAKIIMTEIVGGHILMISNQLYQLEAEGKILGLRQEFVSVPYGAELKFNFIYVTPKGDKKPIELIFALRRSGELFYRQYYFDQSDIVLCHDSSGTVQNLRDFLLASKRSVIPKPRVFVSEKLIPKCFSFVDGRKSNPSKDIRKLFTETIVPVHGFNGCGCSAIETHNKSFTGSPIKEGEMFILHPHALDRYSEGKLVSGILDSYVHNNLRPTLIRP